MSISSLARVASGSLLRSLWNRDRAAARRRGRRAGFAPAIDCLESRRALAITTPLSIGGTTVGSYLDAPTGVDNQSDFVTVSIEGTKGTVIFNGGKGVADGTDIQSVEIVDASPDFQVTFSAGIGTGNAVPYGSDGVIQMGTITTNNVIRGINTVRGPLTNVAAPWEVETSAIHLYTFNDGTVSGTTVTDLVGGLDGTLFNGASVSGGQLVLASNGAGVTGANVQYMQLPADVVPQGSTAATFELWFTASASSGIWSRGFDFGSNNQNYMFFAPRAGGGGSRTAISQTSSAGEQLVNGPTAYNDDTQHLCTVTVDDAADTMVYYIDGVEIGSVSLGTTTLSGLEAINNFLGRSQFAADPGFIGSMNQFAIYDRALSSAEVAANFTAGPIVGALSPIGFTQSAPGSNTMQLVGDQSSVFPVGAFVCATPLLPTPAGAPSFGTVTSSSYVAGTNVTTLVFDNTTATGTTAGALTLAETIQPEFRLTTFVGVNFSNRTLTEGGGIFVDVVQGGDYEYNGVLIPNVGILLSDGLLAYSSIGIRRELAATVLIGPTTDGRMFIESATPESLIVVGPRDSQTAKNSKLEIVGGFGEFGANVQVYQNFDGIVNLAGPSTGTVRFERNVGPLAVLNAQAWADVEVSGNFAGTINSITEGSEDLADVQLDVRGNLASTARVNSESELRVNVGGSILKGAILSADQGTTFTVGGNLLGTIQAGSDFMSGAVAGNVSGATLASSNDIVLSVLGSVVNSTLAADDEFTLNVGGAVRGSTISSGDSEVTFNVTGNVVNSKFVGGLSGVIGGNVTNSQFFAAGDALDSNDPDITLDIAGNMTNSAVQAVSQVTVAVGGNVSKSRFISTTSDVTVDVGGSLTDSTLIAADDGVTLDVGRDATNVKVVGDDSDTSVTVGRNFTGSVQSGSGNLVVDVGGSVLKASSFTTGGNASVDVGGNFDGSVAAKDLRYLVGGNVSQASRIVAQRVRDWGDFGELADPNFSIGGRFDGVVNVVEFDAVVGVAGATIVGGGAGPTARFYVDRFNTDTLVFNGNFRGNLRVLQDLTANLTFNGNVDRITIGGRVGSYTPGNTIGTIPAVITVTGRLLYMNTNSYFQDIGNGDGIFWNVPNTSNPFFATGSLFTGSYGKVVPTLQTQPLPPLTPPQTYTVPGVPTTFGASAVGPAYTNGIQVTFAAPTSDGNLPVLYYEYSTNATAGTPSWRRFDSPAQGPGTNIPLTVDSAGGGWIAGNTYQVSVRAVNALGAGVGTTYVDVTLASDG